MKVNSRLSILVAEKQMRDKRRYSLRTIAELSGASLPTVKRLMDNSMKRVPLDELAKLCAWGQWSVGDILQYEEVSA